MPTANEETLNLTQAQSALEVQQKAFDAVVQQPNTLARNVLLAEHHTETKRLLKLIAKADQPRRAAFRQQ